MADGPRTRYLRRHNPLLYLVSYSPMTLTLERLLRVPACQISFTLTHRKDSLEPNPHMWRPLMVPPCPVPILWRGNRRFNFDSYCPDT